ncbi:hypothetical protein GSI_08445 [Ganoderma sinense ZZ0214-1]|uniref:RNA-directed DNA polymerase n=1 Tax=Ganoderma sinense ZZ0214-1 TaxID=1077348 RepID=A0A2G8S3S2_9APHY|nr:hypothetical protein GSI_08445 [Ganoderma sinense ZZ0214-1]
MLRFPGRKPINTFALVDCGATDSCISLAFANRHHLPRRPKDEPVPILAVDNRPIASGLVEYDVVTSLTVQSHSENLALGVVEVPYPVILGLDWLERHNPHIHWIRRELMFSCCGDNSIAHALAQRESAHTLSSVSSSVRSCAPTALGFGFGINASPFPMCPARSDNLRCADHASSSSPSPHVSVLSTSARPWHAPRIVTQIGHGRNGSVFSIDSPLHPRLSPLGCSRLGRGRTEFTPPPSGDSQAGCGRTGSSPDLDIKFINSARFRKYARTGETAVLYYHPFGTPGYTLASMRYDSGDTTPPENPSPEPPPPEPPPDDPSQHIPDKYARFARVFSPVEVEQLPPHRPGFDATIELEDGKTPPYGPLYHLSEDEHAHVLDYVETNLKKGFIRRSTSSAAAPILFVRKKTGDLRLCVDYRGLNAITRKNRYPLPLIGDLLDRVQGCRVFTTLDLKNAFNLIRIREGDEWKTAFRTHLGLFEYLVMPFGLTNAPGTFQAYIQDALRDLLDVVCVVYIDDILIFSRNQEEHDRHVAMVLERLEKAGLFANAKKCSFDQSEVEYIGYRLNADGIRMDPKKLSTIADWPVPTSVKEVQSFLGFANFYRRFIDNYAKMALPLHALTKKASRDAPFVWSSEANDAFAALRGAILSEPVLFHFNPTHPSTLSTDASDFAIAGVLHQPDDAGHLHPVAYYSRKLSPAEINYQVYDKELLAVVDSFRDMRAWLIGTRDPVTVISDHKNLEYFMSSRLLNRRQARWSIFLSEFNFRLNYAPGLRNPADAPSRRADFAPQKGDEVVEENFRALLTPAHTERLWCNKPSTTWPRQASSFVSVCASSAPPVVISAFTELSVDRSDFKKRLADAVQADPEWRDVVSRGDSKFRSEGNVVYHDGRLYVPRSL